MKFTVSAPGKIILMGEHAVVFGKPAIVATINKRMTVRLEKTNGEIKIKASSEIPFGVGMGSSAAQAVVSAASLLTTSCTKFKLNGETKKIINEIAYESEKINHGNPSGVDNTVVTYGGLLWFKRKNDGTPVFKRFKIKNLPEFVLINTGKPKETTRKMVENVKHKVSSIKYRSKILNLFNQIEKATKQFLKAVKNNNKTLLKNSIKICERNLEKLGVVGKQTRKIVREIEKLGGAAKITGAGGKTYGSGMLLCYHKNSKKIVELAKKFKLETTRVRLGGEGLMIE